MLNGDANKSEKDIAKVDEMPRVCHGGVEECGGGRVVSCGMPTGGTQTWTLCRCLLKKEIFFCSEFQGVPTIPNSQSNPIKDQHRDGVSNNGSILLCRCLGYISVHECTCQFSIIFMLN